VFDSTGCASRYYEVDAGSFSADIAAPKMLYCCESFSFEVCSPFIRFPLTKEWEVESDFGLWYRLSHYAGLGYAGECTRDGLLECGLG
jgi:hypothetical protein